MKKPLFVIDLDRTLIDTDKVVEILAVSLKRQGYDGNSLVEKIEQARLSENDIDVKQTISSLGGKAWEGVWEYFLNKTEKNAFAFDDAKPFLKSLKSAKVPHIILTFGVSKAWQELKLISAGLEEVPTIVTGSREKSKTIEGWRGNNGTYTPPGFAGLSAPRAVLVDDRPNAFSGIQTDNFSGYLVDRVGELKSGFQPPPKVRIIKDLSEIKI